MTDKDDSTNATFDDLVRVLVSARTGQYALDAHAQDVGYIAIAWSRLHDSLGAMHYTLLDPFGQNKRLERIAAAMWGSLKADNAQRDLLEAALRASLPEGDIVRKEMIWVLGQLYPLANDRNNALHAAYKLKIDGDRFTVEPSDFEGNLRSRELKGKNLKEELAWYRSRIEAFHEFILNLHIYHLRGRPPPLPGRPVLQRNEQRKVLREDQKRGAPQRPQRRSSRK